MSTKSVAGVLRLFIFATLVAALPAVALAGAPLQLTDNAVSETSTDLALDAAGNTHVVYERSGVIYYRVKTTDGWKDEEAVATGTSPAVGAGASGVPQVIFLSSGNIWYTTRDVDTGQWQEAVLIGTGSRADLAVDPSGVAHVVYLGRYYGDSYVDIVYVRNATGTFSDPIMGRNGLYEDWGGGSGNGNYYSGPVIAANAAGQVAVAYVYKWYNKYSGGSDWGTQVHVWRSATDDEVSSPDWYKGTYPDPQNNALALDPTGVAYVAYGATLATAVTGSWSPNALPSGSSHTLDLSAAGLHIAFVDPAGGIQYLLATGGGDTPVVLDDTTTGRNPVVRATAAGALVAYEAVDSGDHEVWLAKTANEAPVLASIGDKEANEEELMSFTVSATDGDDDPLTYEATGLPSGATFDADTQTFTWTPSWDSSGTYDVTFSVTDGTDSDSETITITVNDVNQPPVFDTIGDRTVDENEALEFTVVATDVDNNALSYGLSGLPPGASFDWDTGYFSWTPGYDQAGEYTLYFQVTDDGEPNLTTYETITITVNNVNRAPAFDPIGEQTVDEGAALSFTVSATDDDGDSLTYGATGLPTGASFDPDTRTFSWTPAYDQAGTHEGIVFSVTDGTDTDSETISVKVYNVNRAPVLDAIGNKSVDEGATLSFTLSATDADEDKLTYGASGLPAGATLGEGGEFSWTPTHSQSGTFDVELSVSDGTDSDSETITITVNNVNRAPVLDAIGSRSVDEGATLTFSVKVSDPDDDPLTVSASNLPTGASFDPDTLSFSWTPGYDQAGAHSGIVFEVTDGTDTDSETVTITVGNVNRAPVLASIGDKTVNEGATLSFTVSATDADGDGLTYGASSLPTGASFDPDTRTFSWTPGYDQSGTFAGVVFGVTDGTDSDSETITIVVTDVNRAPVLAAVGDRTVKAEETLSFTVSATDADGHDLTYAASNLPAGATFDPDTRTFSWTPTRSQAGAHSGIVFTVTDDGTPNASDTETISITVTGVNLPTDFNGDGTADILWHNQTSGDLYAWMLDGTVTTGGSYLTPKGLADTRWQIRGVADFTGDGKVDVLWHNQSNGELYVWCLDGTVTTTGSYLTPRSFSDTRWQIRAVGDLDTDGKPDILWHHQTNGELYVWFMNGLVVKGGAYLTPKAFADTKWKIRGLADFNGDGKLDLLWHHQTNGELYVWYLDGTVTVGGSYLTPKAFADTNWKIVKVADFNADGKADLLWHNQLSGDLYVWFLNGTVVTGGSYLTPKSFSAATWRVVPQ